MLIDTSLLQFCVAKTRELTQAYLDQTNWPDEKQRSVDELGQIVHYTCGKPIYFRQLKISVTRSKLRAICMPKNDGWYIYLLQDMDLPMLRYTKCKEIFQIHLDQELLRTTDVVDLVRNMILRSSPTSAELNLGHATNSETIAELGALEFLFPYADRLSLQESIKGADGYKKIAEDYAIPQHLVERCMSASFLRDLAPHFGVPSAVAAD